MPDFIAIQIDTAGNRQRAVIEAPTLAAAQRAARQAAGIVVAVRPATLLDRLSTRLGARNQRVSSAALQRFCHTIAAYLKAGVSIQEGLRLVAESPPELRRLADATRLKLSAGYPLDQALAQSGFRFSIGFLALVRAGLEAGKIEDILENEARREKVLLEIRRDLVASLIYPLILIIMSSIVVLFMLVVIVPQIRSGLPNDALQRAPLISQVIFVLSDTLALMSNGWGLLVTITVFGVIFSLALIHRVKLVDWLTMLPGFRSIVRSLRAASFCHSLGVMLESAVRAEVAWRLSVAAIRSKAAKTALEMAGTRIVQGAPMSVAITEAGIMPPDVVSVFALGERTGTLPRLLVDVAQLHAGEATSRLKKLSGVLVPVIILISGALVGSFAVAMMMTIQSVNQIYGG